MNESLVIRKNCIEICRNYPLLKIYFGANEGVFGGITVPKWLYLISSNNRWLLVITKNKFELLDPQKIPEIRGCKLHFESYSAGKYTPHDIHGELFPILNRLCPFTHYSHKLISEEIEKDRTIANGPCDSFGEDLVEMVSRVACHYVSRKFFKNSIGLIKESDPSEWGEDLILMIDDAADISPVFNDRLVKNAMADNFEMFGDDLVNYVVEKCQSIYLSLEKRFNDYDMIEHIINNDDMQFISYYKYL